MKARIAAFVVWALAAAGAVYWALRLLAAPAGLPPSVETVSVSGALKGDIARLFASAAPASEALAMVEESVARCAEQGLRVEGLMTVGRTGSPADARSGFAVLRGLADRLDLTVRSMGMSGDLEVAVEEGSTMVRVGSALFGPRPSVPGTSAGPR